MCGNSFADPYSYSDKWKYCCPDLTPPDHHSFRLAFKNKFYILFGHKYVMRVIHGVS